MKIRNLYMCGWPIWRGGVGKHFSLSNLQWGKNLRKICMSQKKSLPTWNFFLSKHCWSGNGLEIPTVAWVHGFSHVTFLNTPAKTLVSTSRKNELFFRRCKIQNCQLQCCTKLLESSVKQYMIFLITSNKVHSFWRYAKGLAERCLHCLSQNM